MLKKRRAAKDFSHQSLILNWLEHVFSHRKFVVHQSFGLNNANLVFKPLKVVPIVMFPTIAPALNSIKIAVKLAKLVWYLVLCRKNVPWAFYMAFHLMIRTIFAAMKWKHKTLLRWVKMKVSMVLCTCSKIAQVIHFSPYFYAIFPVFLRHLHKIRESLLSNMWTNRWFVRL